MKAKYKYKKGDTFKMNAKGNWVGSPESQFITITKLENDFALMLPSYYIGHANQKRFSRKFDSCCGMEEFHRLVEIGHYIKIN